MAIGKTAPELCFPKFAILQAYFKENAIDISAIKNETDFRRIPITAKEDLQLHDLDFLAVDYMRLSIM